jgi:spore coat polysaccharide biosynthesis protein SpsF
MVYIIIIQARMGSTRLPGKVMKKLLDKEIVLWSYDRCLKTKVDDVFIATSINTDNDVLEKLFIENKIKYYRGSEMDLLDRYYQISNKYYFDNSDKLKCKKSLKIIRITSDCPFVDNEIINSMIDFYEVNKFNYIINHNKDAITPEGSCVEIIDFNALEYLWSNEYNMEFREHATGLLSVITKYNDVIKIGRYSYLPSKEVIDYNIMKNIKVSIDTIEDYEQAQCIVNHFKNYNFNYLDILCFLQSKYKTKLNINTNTK